MNKFVEHIVSELSKAPNVSGYGLAHKNERGQVVVWDNGEGVNVAPTDAKGNYFYIRTFDNKGFTERKSNERGCHERHEVTGAFRLVAVWRCEDPYTLINHFKKLLLSAKNSYNIYTRKGIAITRTNAFHDTIYREEIGGDIVRFSPGVKLISIDFKLNFEYDLCNLEDAEICKQNVV